MPEIVASDYKGNKNSKQRKYNKGAKDLKPLEEGRRGKNETVRPGRQSVEKGRNNKATG